VSKQYPVNLCTIFSNCSVEPQTALS